MTSFAARAGAVALALLTAGCFHLTLITPQPALTPTCQDDSGIGGPEIGFLWLADYKDATVACNGAAPGRACQGIGDQNFGDSITLDIDYKPAFGDFRRAYAAFYFPGLPPGVNVIQAYINLFDLRPVATWNPNRLIAGTLAAGAWDPMTVTWNNQPNHPSTAQIQFSLLSRPTDWSSSQDLWGDAIMTPIIQGWIASGDSNDGFYFHDFNVASPLPVGISYPSDNAFARTGTDMDNAPRMILVLDQPVTCAQLNLRPIPVETDLGVRIAGPNVLMVRAASGTGFPPSWMVPPPPP